MLAASAFSCCSSSSSPAISRETARPTLAVCCRQIDQYREHVRELEGNRGHFHTLAWSISPAKVREMGIAMRFSRRQLTLPALST